MSLWNIFKNNFRNIINDIEEYNKIFINHINYDFNILLYSHIGFPLELFIDELIKSKFNLININRKELLWNKNIIYNENQYFIEIDLNNPNITSDFSFLTDMILFIIKNKPIFNSNKHLIILKNIDHFNEFSYAFRIILERFNNNVYFICTTNKISKIENAIKSRFFCIRIRLFTIDEIKFIFQKYLKLNLNEEIEISRNIIFNIFLQQIKINEPLLLTEEFYNYNYPPIVKFYNSKYDLNDIRQLSYKLSQYNLKIVDITLDLLKLNNNNNKSVEIIKIASEIDYLLSISNKGREPIYIENFLCQILL